MPYRIAGIDVHKKMLAVVVADVEVDGEFDFERQKAGTTPTDLRRLADWLVEHEVEEVVMESTAQYWRPVWEALEQHWRPRRRARDGAPRLAGTLHLAQAQSNRGRGGRKKDFPDAERLVKRLVAQELTLSFVPDAEQRLWRTVMRRKYQVTRNRVQLQNRLEALLEEAHIKVSSVVSDLLGVSARRMLQALAGGETAPAALATLAAPRLRATPEQLCDAFHASATLHPVYRRLLALTLEELRMIEEHLGQLDQQMADLLTAHHDAVQRLAEVPGLGVDSAQQIIAEVGATAATFPSSKHLASWGRLPRQRGECRRELQPPLPQRQPADATYPQPSRERCGEGQGDDLCRRLPSDRPTPRTCPSDWRHQPPTLPIDLEDPARVRPVRGTGAGRQRRGEEGPRAQDDPRAAKSRLSRRTSPSSIEQPGMIERFSTLAHPRSGVNSQHFRPVRQSFARSQSRRTLCSRNSASRFRNRPDPTTEEAVWCGGRGAHGGRPGRHRERRITDHDSGRSISRGDGADEQSLALTRRNIVKRMLGNRRLADR
jgi:transposase